MLTNIGGMQITPGAMNAPSRTDDPPGTMRTPSAAPPKRRSGSVSLSKNGQGRSAVSDMSTVSPKRNPMRMPCLTHAFTRQPEGLAASFSAARTRPAESSARRRANASRATVRSALAPAEASASMSSFSIGEGTARPALHQGGFQQIQTFQHLQNSFARFLLRRAHRQAIDLFEQT